MRSGQLHILESYSPAQWADVMDYVVKGMAYNAKSAKANARAGNNAGAKEQVDYLMDHLEDLTNLIAKRPKGI